MASRASLMASVPCAGRCDSGLFATTSSGAAGGPPAACAIFSRAPLQYYAPRHRRASVSSRRRPLLRAGPPARRDTTVVAAGGGSAKLLTSLAHGTAPLLPAPAVEAAFLPAGRAARQTASHAGSEDPLRVPRSSATTAARPPTPTPSPSRDDGSTAGPSPSGSPPRAELPQLAPVRPPAAVSTGNANSLDTGDAPPGEAPLYSLGWPEFDRGRYRAQGVLGSGGYGTVYLALDEVTGDLVAVKRIPKTRKSSAPTKVRRNLLKEAELLEAMQFCPSVVRLHAKFEDERNAYLVMQHLEGGSLEDYVQRNRRQLSEDDVAAVCMVVLQFLAEAHAAGVVFADVKPSNFMLTGGEGGRPLALQVIDFGCSQPAPTEGNHLTQRCGTYKYFAPEVYHQRYGAKADVWSCGIMVYRILSSNYPWWKAGAPVAPAEAMGEICGDEPIPFPTQDWERWSPEARQFVEHLLERDPAARPSAAEAMAHPWLTAHLASYHRALQQAEAETVAAPAPSANNVVPLSACRNKSWFKREQHDEQQASMNCAAL